MPVLYKPLPNLRFDNLFDGRLVKFRIYERVTSKTTATHRSVTDGTNSVWVDSDANGLVEKIAVWGNNDAEWLFAVITFKYSVKIISEFEPQYWGFDSEDEWHIAVWVDDLSDSYSMLIGPPPTQISELSAMEDIHRRVTMLQILRHQIAARLIDADPSLREVENKHKLLRAAAVEYHYLRQAIALEEPADGAKMAHRASCAWKDYLSEEDLEEGPSKRFRYEQNGAGQIVAVEQPDPRAHGPA
jgi:hypothetical protein